LNGIGGYSVQHVILDEAYDNEESNVVKLRRKHSDQPKPVKTRVRRRAGVYMETLYNARHKYNVKNKNRAANRVARKSRRINRHKR
jgi:hypothetical protein